MKCLQCEKEIPINKREDVRKKFCNLSCAALFNNSKRGPISEEQKEKISISLKRKYKSDNPPKTKSPEEQSKLVGKATKNKYKGDEVQSILELSSRTVSKLIRRMKLKCSRCSWDEGTCDIHHINGRKIPDPHNHKNLCILCPNCHRLAHNKKIKKEDLIPLENYIKDDWKEHYYG
jgi:hypothetical protein